VEPGFPTQSRLRRLRKLICISRSDILKSITFTTSMSIYRNIEIETMSIYRNIEIETMSIHRNLGIETMSIHRNLGIETMSIHRNLGIETDRFDPKSS
jgi:hypothetical protein